ncbi:MAG: trigger factor [Bacteroidia bacterium]|jgi:trigger factor
MNVTFEKKDSLNGTISVNVGNADYAGEVDKKLKDYQKKSNIPGFRPGMAPKGMIEKMFGTSILLEAVNAAASKGLFDYIDEHKLAILGQPVLNEDSKIEELAKGKEYTFRFDIGLSPEFTLNVSADDVFTRYEVSIDDKMIDEEVDRMRKRFGNLHDVETAGENDIVYSEMLELDENQAVLEGGVSAASVPVLTSTLKNDAIKNEFIGASVGKQFAVNIFDLFDNDETEMSHALGINKHTVSDIGKNFQVTIKEIKHNEQAELNQELFDKAYGEGNVTTEAELRERVKGELSSYFGGQADHLFEHELVDTLVAKQDIPLPDEFLKRWLIDRHADKFNATNVDHEYQHEAEYLRNHLFEERVLSDNGVKIEDADIRAAAINYTRSMFGAYGNTGINEEMLASIVEPSLKKDDYRSRMINIAVSNKVREVLKTKISVNTQIVTSEEFFKQVTAHNEKHHHQHSH